MSYDPQHGERPHGTSRDGARRNGSAQERDMQDQTLDGLQISGLPRRPNQLVSQFSTQNQQNQAQSPSGSQWPLPNQADNEAPIPPRNPARPQRPIRVVPTELSPPEPEQRSSYNSDDFLSPSTSSRPLTTSSGISETSSLGDIPDFPVPVPQPMPRRQPSLGPPPSARRGPASYYPQTSYVSPIAEESESRAATIRSRTSFASSNVFPSKDDDYYHDDDSRSDDDVTITSDNGRRSTASDHDDRSGLVQPTLVRQASLGRRTKPSLTTIKSVDNFDKRTPSLKRKAVAEGDNATARAAVGNAILAARDGLAGRPALSSQTSVLLDPSSSSEESLATKRDARTRLANLDPDEDIPDRDFEKDFEKEIMVTPPHPLQQGIKPSKLADRVGNRRPPRLDVDAVREAEARGSLSSLPELIRRATRLAANLDRGKTASRLGLELWESGGSNKEVRQSGTLSDMLAAFPPPGEATPTGNMTPSRPNGTKWPSVAEGLDGQRGTSSEKSHGRRRCCGMPMWTFVTLLIVLLFLIAAAVIIPVVLIVIPKMKDGQTSASHSTSATNLPVLPVPTGTRKDQCEGIISCQNGGVAILTGANSCNCVCINGFTGKTCETKVDVGCSTINVSGTADNATVGSSIPRLFEKAEKFGIPLDTQRILSLFSDVGLTCSTENALVTFNGISSRSVQELETYLVPLRSLPVLDALHQLNQRQAIGEAGELQPTPSSTLKTDPSPTPAPMQTFSKNKTALDFARVGILLLLQETGELDDAAQAQTDIQNYLGDKDSSSSTSQAVVFDLKVFQLDVSNFRIEFKNGTVLQANPMNTV